AATRLSPLSLHDALPIYVELPVLALHEPFRTGHDHCANGVRAHDMGVVVDFDTARHPFQPEGPGESFQQSRLRRRLRKPPSEGRSEEHTSELQSRENLVC